MAAAAGATGTAAPAAASARATAALLCLCSGMAFVMAEPIVPNVYVRIAIAVVTGLIPAARLVASANAEDKEQ